MANAAPSSRAWRLVRRFGPAGLVLGGLALALGLGLNRYVSLEALSENYGALRAWIAERPLIAGGVFVAVYALAVTVSLPGALWFTIAAGALFGWPLGAGYAWAGALMGAVLVFLAARSALADVLAAKAGGRVAQFKAGFERDAFSYLLLLRLIPLPFFLVNVAPAFFKVKLRDYAGATALGIIPGGLAYAALGAGAGDVIAAGGTLDLSILAQPKVLFGMGALAALALAPLLLKGRRARLEGN